MKLRSATAPGREKVLSLLFRSSLGKEFGFDGAWGRVWGEFGAGEVCGSVALSKFWQHFNWQVSCWFVLFRCGLNHVQSVQER